MSSLRLQGVSSVATARFRGRGFGAISKALHEAGIAEPEQAPGAWLSCRWPPLNFHVGISRNDQLRLSGARTVEEVHKRLEVVAADLYRLGLVQDFDEPVIHNIVASGSFVLTRTLPWIYTHELPGIELSYEPEQFPALQLRQGKAVMLLYRSGKFMVVGLKSIQDAQRWCEAVAQGLQSLSAVLIDETENAPQPGDAA